MKKFGLLTTLLISGLLLTGCNKTVEKSEVINEEITSPVIMTVTESGGINNIDCGSFNGETQRFTECYDLTGYFYTFTRPDIKLRITTDKYSGPWFLEKTDEPFIELTGNEIVGIEGRVESWTCDNIRIYRKDPNKPLKDILEEKHLNSGCKLIDRTDHYVDENGLLGVKSAYIVWPENDVLSSNNITCRTDDIDPNEYYPRVYYEGSDPSLYYKIFDCPSGPIGKFIGKVELL